ncbi:hypothetical protein AKJ09_07429 [Labilithrix luteola]|uniref:BON domain-containing protein n=1 Tax=Labilithrix luteola TaxID=1391654 RepID=A0A0K1Q4M5_9BACT|nr:BON domain-containing protein [Labilithrix luteola]AKV00766.1 hypothetical protein AKJ09_07429 [Labilithrix luteola]
MRHYEREQYRHLDDAERYRDYDYLADDSWLGPNERVPEVSYRRSIDASEGRAYSYSRERGRDEREHEPVRGRDEVPWQERGGREVLRGRRERGHFRGPQAHRPSVLSAVLVSLLRSSEVVRRRLQGLLFRARRRGSARIDQHMREEICERLARDPEIDDRDIAVYVRNGEVTLEGSVTDRRMRYLTEDVLAEVLGIRDVENRLRVRAARR